MHFSTFPVSSSQMIRSRAVRLSCCNVSCRKLSSSPALRKVEAEDFDVNKSKFSESLAFKSRQREFIENRNARLHIDKPNLGDYYDTFKFARKEKWVGVGSIVAFMVYFTVLREENDVDAKLYRPLWMSVPALEKQVIEHKMVQAQLKGEDTSELEDRLEELTNKAKKYEEEQKNTKKTWKTPWEVKVKVE